MRNSNQSFLTCTVYYICSMRSGIIPLKFVSCDINQSEIGKQIYVNG